MHSLSVVSLQLISSHFESSLYTENVTALNPHPGSTQEGHCCALCQHTRFSAMSWGSDQQAELSYNAPRLAGAQANSNTLTVHPVGCHAGEIWAEFAPWTFVPLRDRQ